jgi:hypothetical protein
MIVRDEMVKYLVEEETGLPDAVELDELLEANVDDPDMCKALEKLEPGETYFGGGGAAPEFAVHCVDDDG